MATYHNLLKKLAPYGVFSVANTLTSRYPRILMYHRFSDGGDSFCLDKNIFEEQVLYLKRNYEVIPIGQLLSKSPRIRSTSPKPRVVITIDDGYHDFYEHAFPILKSNNIPATFFVTTGFIDGTCWLWQDRLKWCIDNGAERNAPLTIDGLSIDADEWNAQKELVWRKLVSSLLTKHGDSIERFLTELSDAVGVQIPGGVPSEYRPVNWDQLRELEANGIEVGGHTVNHYSLGRLDKDAAEREIKRCSERLEQELGKASRPFCYPNGQPGDIPSNYGKVLRDAGFNSSVVAFYDKLGVKDRYAMRRHGIGNSWFGFQKSVCGVDRLGAVLLGRNSLFDWGVGNG